MKHSAKIFQDKMMEHARVTVVVDKMPDYPEIINLTETFKILGDPTRLRIMLALNRRELCVRELTAVIQLSVSAISHQLRLLRGMKLVKFRKQGKWVYYSLDDHHIESIIQQAQIHVHELSPVSAKEKA
jgi:DNA-binding transcriptional ArsR family regulator